MSTLSESSLNLRVGEEVEIKSQEEILRTLDRNGDLDVLPFMPEMLQYCGRRFRVAKRAHKTCDTIDYQGMRRMENAAVHLEGLRCDGASHGGCQARCILFWKEAWLRRVGDPHDSGDATSSSAPVPAIETLAEQTQSSEGVFRCQATEMNRATTALPTPNLRVCMEDVASGNIRVRDVLRWIVFDAVSLLMRFRGYRALLWTYNRVSRWLGGADYPVFQGSLTRTPLERLDLQPGELVRIKDRDAIVGTLDAKNRNRGLSFDIEMVNFCGRKARVLQRVERIIDEKTGRMLTFPNPTIILDDIICQGYYKNRGCPRSIYPYWREIWLERIER